MKLRSAQIQGFRSLLDFSIEFDPLLTTLVGENNIGKSTLFLGIHKTLLQSTTGNDQIEIPDYPYSMPGKLIIQVVFELSPVETKQAFMGIMVSQWSSESQREMDELLVNQGNLLAFRLTRNDGSNRTLPLITFGSLHFYSSFMSKHSDFLDDKARSTKDWNAHHNDIDERGAIFGLNENASALLGNFVLSRFKQILEFRARSASEQRAQSIESVSGSDTASVLLNLKNHHERGERLRYGQIVDSFRTLVPRYDVEAVETSPGKPVPDVHFQEEGQSNPVHLTHVSAGVHQVLALLTVLIGRSNLVILVEHPEQHLHPHSMRFLNRMLRESSRKSQIIVVTHDPHFVDWIEPLSLRRIAWNRALGSVGFQLSPATPDKNIEQIRTALRHLSDRDLVFARAVLLVEDESQRNFVVAVASKLQQDLDAHAISVVSVDGEDGYRPYITLLDGLNVPYVALRDKVWGDASSYPPPRFFSMGMELEDYLDEHGLRTRRAEVVKEVGRSKQRVAGALGESITADEVPDLFRTVLEAVIELSVQRV